MIKKENLLKRKAKISYFEIFILMISLFAFSYMMHQYDVAIDRARGIENNKDEKNGIVLIFLKEWMKRSKILNLVSAEEPFTYNYDVFGEYQRVTLDSLNLSCCISLNNTAKCQNILTSRCNADCAGGCLPTECEQTDVCKLGCCIDEEEGSCAVNTPKDSCDGTWIDDSNCNNPACKNACCVVGSQSFFTTEKRCEKISSFYGMDKDFRKAVSTEIECIALSYAQEEGACIIKTDRETGCRFTTKSECIGLTKNARNFYKGYLCSNPALNTSCNRQAKTGCVSERDGVYWFDSCGNKENIYSANKEQSWNNGLVLSISESCNPTGGNINSVNCGNCDYFLGSICSKANGATKPAYGDYICKDLNCYNAPDNVGKKDRKNGESWCVYDSFVGEGKDVVGSRHWRYYCIDGKVEVEPCGDFRTGICVQGENEGFASASCRPNRAMECISYNSEEENIDGERLEEECEENSDCQMRNFDFGKGYKFSVCTPKYPIGFDMKNNAEIGEQICNQADFTCTKVEVKEYTGWKCVAGCKCDSAKFTQDMHDYCVSLGDCGGYVNILGKTDEGGYSISKAPKIDLSQYLEYVEPVKEQFAEPGDFTKQFAAAYGWGAGTSEEYSPEDYSAAIGLSAVVLGLAGKGAIMLWGGTAVTATAAAVPASSPFMAGMGSAFIGAGIGMGVGLMMASMLGLQGQGMIGLGVAGALVGGGVAIILTATEAGATICGGSGGTACIVGAIIIVIGLVLGAVTALLGVGKVKKTKVVFNCNPYQPPKGGADCDKCLSDSKLTGDGFKECSRYRCQSLGQTCEFINEGTKYETCFDNSPNDVSAPIISRGSYITPGFVYANETTNGFSILSDNGDCIPEFSPVIYGIETLEAAQCKYDIIHTNNYDEMQFYVGESSLYLKNHTIALLLPSMNSLFNELKENMSEEEQANLVSILRQKTGDLNFFVRCKDKNGNSNVKEYAIKTCVKPGDDLTPPYIAALSLPSSSYLKYGENEKNITIWVNEPADCRYSFNNIQYADMNNSFTCLTSLDDVSINGWACYTEINNLNEIENNIHIKCEDQPWLKNTENESKRNPMQQPAIVKLLSSKSELYIKNIFPNSTISIGQEPETVVARAETYGGANDEAECRYSFTGSDYTPFLNTNAKMHSQTFNRMMGGSYTLYLKCEDEAGNVAEASTGFVVDLDSASPVVQRAYKNQNRLYITTDEDAKCFWSIVDCEYNINNASMMLGINKEHTADWDLNGIYYIKCVDIWENSPLGCSLIAKPENVLGG